MPHEIDHQLVGRAEVLGELFEALEQAAAGRGRSVLLLGETGTGKTAIAEAVSARAAAREIRTAHGRCSAAGMPPFWPWRRIFRHALGTGLLGDQAGDPGPVELQTGELGRQRLFVAATEALEDLCRSGPALLVLEDVHWADEGSLLLLASIVDVVPGLPAMVLVTCRDEPGEPAPAVRTRLTALPPQVRRVELGGLTEAAVGELSAAVGGTPVDPETARQLCVRTGGNPLFVTELTRLGRSGPTGAPPTGVREVVNRRVFRLSPACREVLAAAAVCGAQIDEPLLVAVTGLPEAELLGLLDEAVNARLLLRPADRPGATQFGHDLIREVLEAGLAAGDRRRLHELAAGVLELKDPPPPHHLVHHWCNAAGAFARQRATQWLLTAAREAVTQLGFEQAVRYFRQVLDADPDGAFDGIGVLLELGQAQRLSGDPASARESFLRAGTAARAAGRPADQARAALGIGGGVAGFEVSVLDRRQADELRMAEAALAGGDDSSLLAAVRARRSLALPGAGADRIALARSATELARRSGDLRVEAAALAAYCDAVAGPDFPAERVAAARRIAELGTAAGDPIAVLLARRLLVVALCELGDFAAVDDEIEAYRAVAAVVGIPLYLWPCELWAGMRALMRGDLATAGRHVQEAERIGTQAGSANADIMTFSLRLQLFRSAGRPADFVAEMRATVARFDVPRHPTYLAVPAVFCLEAGEPADGEQLLADFLRRPPEQIPPDAEWLEGHWALAELAVALADRPAARRLLDTLRPFRDLWAVDGIGAAVFGVIGEQLGRLAGVVGLDREATVHLERARECYRTAGEHSFADRVQALLDGPAGPALVVVAETPPVRRTAAIAFEGASWRLTWQERSSTVPDSKGMRDLARLLSRPRVPVSVLDLVEAAGGRRAAEVGGDLGALLDGPARAAYRRRLAELEVEVAEADHDADLGRLERLRIEQSFLATELASAVGLAGRPRRGRDPVERARTSVTMRIRSAIAAVGRVDPGLGRHLRGAVQTGRMCGYQPESEITWQISRPGPSAAGTDRAHD